MSHDLTKLPKGDSALSSEIRSAFAAWWGDGVRKWLDDQSKPITLDHAETFSAGYRAALKRKPQGEPQGAIVTKELTEQLRGIAAAVRAGDCIGTVDDLEEIVANFEVYAVDVTPKPQPPHEPSDSGFDRDVMELWADGASHSKLQVDFHLSHDGVYSAVRRGIRHLRRELANRIEMIEAAIASEATQPVNGQPLTPELNDALNSLRISVLERGGDIQDKICAVVQALTMQ